MAIQIFGNTVCQQAIHWINSKRHSNVSKKEWVVMSPAMFEKAYLAPEDLPYKPINDFAKGKEDFSKMLENKSWRQIDGSLRWWGNAYYQYSYIPEEADLIVNLILDVWKKLMNKKTQMSDEDILRFSIFAEDYPAFPLEEF